MNSRTIATLNRLEKASWFSRVGINEGSSAAVVRSWPEAIEHCDSSAWEDLQGEALFGPPVVRAAVLEPVSRKWYSASQ